MTFGLPLPNAFVAKWVSFKIVNQFEFYMTFDIIKNMERYNHFNKWLKEKFGERTLKICIDGGFTCPNRDGTLSTKGCLYCTRAVVKEMMKNNSGGLLAKVGRNVYLCYR